MPKQKGSPKTGGRKKGTANVITRFTKEKLAGIIDHYTSTGQLDADLLLLEPKDRLMIMERFMQYTIPKMQAVSIDLDAENTVKTIEDKLREHMADYEESK